MLEQEDPSTKSRPTTHIATVEESRNLTDAERIAEDYEAIIKKFMAAGFEHDSNAPPEDAT
jgi:hypothetical protein